MHQPILQTKQKKMRNEYMMDDHLIPQTKHTLKNYTNTNKGFEKKCEQVWLVDYCYLPFMKQPPFNHVDERLFVRK